MMFVGDQGAIVAGFMCEHPEIVGERAARYAHVKGQPTVAPPNETLSDGTARWLQTWIDGCRGKGKGAASFENAKEVNETFNLGSVSLMCNGKKLLYDPRTRTVTNDETANKLLSRKVRRGWEI
jgi:hypothetical protein